jgi:hypothetical protein
LNQVQQILSGINWPIDVLVLDFETYFDDDYTLKGKKSRGMTAYVADPRFEFTGLGVHVTRPRFFGGDDVETTIEQLKNKFGKALHNCTVVTKNNKFDVLILAEKFGIYPPYTIDIEDLSRYYDSRMSQKLEDLAKHFKLPPKGDTTKFKGLHSSDMTPEQRRAMREYCLRDIEDEVALLNILLPTLHDPGIELDLGRHTLNLYLKPILELDIEQAKRIALGMENALSSDISKAAWVLRYRTKAKPNIPKILRAKKLFPEILQAELDRVGTGEQVPMKKGKKGMIPATAKEDVGFQLLLAHQDKRVHDLCQAKAACSSWSLHQKKVQRMIIEAECTGGKLRIPLNYYGAHTGRWSGGGGWNPLNLGGKGRGNPIHPLIGQVRNTLVAPDGYMLVVVDSAQIEARELAWAAHQEDLVKGFANHEDIYSNFASELFQTKIWKVSEEEAATPEGKKVSIMRGFGKDAILGCGYGMGSDTFYDRCRQNGSLRPHFDSGEYDWNFIDKLIKVYRTKYADIPAFWKEIERCFRIVTKYPGQETSYEISVHAAFEFSRTDTTTRIQLPSGRPLTYRHAVVTPKGDNLKYIWGPLWGGTLTENVIQAMCRCLFAGWLLECEANSIPIVLHLYDELVGCVPEDQAEEKLAQMISIMEHGPKWADGLPLSAEGFTTKRFKK